MNNRKNLPIFLVVVVLSWLVMWVGALLLFGFMAWCFGSALTFGVSLITATCIWLLLFVGALVLLNFNDM